ncbi:MAG: alpha/beta hydrolase [Candidatus Gracilibacteria bacterium]|nr:alpha/beta hydrolase [Candidatus Gracilibacteria bacterium]
MKILGIHGFKRTDKVVDFFKKTGENLAKFGIEVFSPDFEIGEKILYKNWEKLLDSLDVKSFDTIFAHSMGCRVAMEYIIEKQIYIKKLLLIAPAIHTTRKEVQDFYIPMKHKFSEINKYVEEIIILVSLDDTVIRIDGAKELARQTGAKFIEVNGYGHFNFEEVSIIEDILKE